MTSANVTATVPASVQARFTGFPVALPLFDGPLDLLHYLIKRQELDIYDIPIARITGQFLAYTAALQQLDVERAAEFLVTAASLIEIKARMLLPRPPKMEDDPDGAEEEDPRAELVRRLAEYERFKALADDLRLRATEESRVFGRAVVVPRLDFDRPAARLDGEPDAFALWAALQEVLARVEEGGHEVREVSRRRFTIRGQMVRILKLLALRPDGVPFAEVFLGNDEGHVLTRTEVIVTFLAMLELMRIARIAVYQRVAFGPIVLRLRAARCPAD